MGTEGTTGSLPGMVLIDDEQADIPGAALLSISDKLEAFSARVVDPDAAVRAQKAAVPALAGILDDWLHDLARARTVLTFATQLILLRKLLRSSGRLADAIDARGVWLLSIHGPATA